MGEALVKHCCMPTITIFSWPSIWDTVVIGWCNSTGIKGLNQFNIYVRPKYERANRPKYVPQVFVSTRYMLGLSLRLVDCKS